MVLDTTSALYLWEWPFYPQYQIPFEDIDPSGAGRRRTHRVSRGKVATVGLRVGPRVRSSAGRRYVESVVPDLVGTVRFDWEALDAWYEEDELVFVHPRNPYVRVDALRSSRHIRVERDGILLAESASPILVFETGLPTRYYFDRTAVNFAQLKPSPTVTACPYKGRRPDTGRYGPAGDEYRSGLELRLPDAAVAADRRPRGLLRRTGRHVHRQRRAAPARNPLLQAEVNGLGGSENKPNSHSGASWVPRPDGRPATGPGASGSGSASTSPRSVPAGKHERGHEQTTAKKPATQ